MGMARINKAQRIDGISSFRPLNVDHPSDETVWSQSSSLHLQRDVKQIFALKGRGGRQESRSTLNRFVCENKLFVFIIETHLELNCGMMMGEVGAVRWEWMRERVILLCYRELIKWWLAWRSSRSTWFGHAMDAFCHNGAITVLQALLLFLSVFDCYRKCKYLHRRAVTT